MRVNMKGIQIISPGNAKVIDVPIPEVKDNEVLVKVKACVTCPHWDITLYKGIDIFERPGYPKYPIPVGYPGHEMSGEVAEVGKAVKTFKKGDRVATLVTAGETSMGFYVEYINRPEDTIVRIPDNVPYPAGASMEMARYVNSYIRLLGDVSGKKSGVTGVGPAGLIALQILKALGAKPVIAVDVNPERLKLALELGADDTINPSSGDAEKVRKEPFRSAVDCSGISSGLQFAVDNTSGPVAVFGVPHGNIVYGMKQWRASILSGGIPAKIDTDFVIELWKTGKLNTSAIVTAELPFEKYKEGIEMLIAKKAVKVCFCP